MSFVSIVTAVFLTCRPQFLVLSFSVVIFATAIALYGGALWSAKLFGLVLLGALLAHAAVNMLNEYQDFHSGLDSTTQRTPFSGGSGALQSTPQAAPWVLRSVFILVVILAGLAVYFTLLKGWMILPIGVAGLLIALTYTTWITRQPWLCLISPGLAFGPLMVLGVYFIWTGSFSWLALALSLVPFFLTNNLLLLNQIPDITADRTVGRFNILMKLGLKKGIDLFILFTGLAYLALVFVIAYFRLPLEVTIGFATLVLAVPMVKRVFQSQGQVEKLMPALAMNVIINLLMPILIGMGLLIAM